MKNRDGATVRDDQQTGGVRGRSRERVKREMSWSLQTPEAWLLAWAGAMVIGGGNMLVVSPPLPSVCRPLC